MFFGGGFPSSKHLKPLSLERDLIFLTEQQGSSDLFGCARIAEFDDREFSSTCDLNT